MYAANSMPSESQSDIMVIDDEVPNLKFLVELLKRSGYHVRPLLNGHDAFRSIQRELPDLILLDIRMPGMDGYEVCQQLQAQEETRHIPVIFLSALSDVAEKIRAFDAGGVDYITKPLQEQEVLARIKTHLHASQLHRQLREKHQQLCQLADATFEALIVHRPTGEILEANQAALALFRCKLDELIGRNLFAWIAPSVQEWIEGEICEQPRETEILTCDKTIVPVEMQFDAVQWNSAAAQITAIRNIRWRKTLEAENFALHLIQSDQSSFGRLVGKSLMMRKVYERLTQAAATRDTIIISGETGTGKELAARIICELSQKATCAFVPVNCGALQESLFESQFFGYRKGAFTGADRDTPGFFEHANGGILFLDEVEELTPLMQAKLLRVLQEREFTPVGAAKPHKTDVRIIAATNQPLRSLVRSGKMREDFFHRLHVIPIEMPPLRERKEDIPLLIAHFLKERSQVPPPDAREILDRFLAYDWPGNVRELSNELRRYLTTGEIELGGQSAHAAAAPRSTTLPTLSFLQQGMTLTEAVSAFEQFYIAQTLREHHDRKSETAKALGIGRRTLYTKLNLPPEE